MNFSSASMTLASKVEGLAALAELGERGAVSEAGDSAVEDSAAEDSAGEVLTSIARTGRYITASVTRRSMQPPIRSAANPPKNLLICRMASAAPSAAR